MGMPPIDDLTKTHIDLFTKFILDNKDHNMYVRGMSGTGKTTKLYRFVEVCNTLDISVIVLAHTHKACDVLKSKLPQGTDVNTIHSFLKKRPMINQEAQQLNHVQTNVISGMTNELPRVVIVDEYGVVGENDYMDLIALKDGSQKYYDEGSPCMKLLLAGDVYQLSPVGDKCTIVPKGPYDIILSKQYRSKGELGKLVNTLVSFLDGSVQPHALPESSKFKRGCADLVETYKELKGSKFLLAYTNERVEQLNVKAQGYSKPKKGDTIFSSSMNSTFTFISALDSIDIAYVDQRWKDEVLEFGSKWKTLEYLVMADLCDFYLVEDEAGDEFVWPAVFGTKQYKIKEAKLMQIAVASNNEILQIPGVTKAASWARDNPSSVLTRDRAKAWRAVLTFNELIHSFDFEHARTVHKSQGSTVDHVVIDTANLSICKDKNFRLYMELFYVAVGRARLTVTTN